MKVRRGFLALLMTVLFLGACSAQTNEPAKESTTDTSSSSLEGGTIQVGILHSLSGTMAISEVSFNLQSFN